MVWFHGFRFDFGFFLVNFFQSHINDITNKFTWCTADAQTTRYRPLSLNSNYFLNSRTLSLSTFIEQSKSFPMRFPRFATSNWEKSFQKLKTHVAAFRRIYLKISFRSCHVCVGWRNCECSDEPQSHDVERDLDFPSTTEGERRFLEFISIIRLTLFSRENRSGEICKKTSCLCVR